MKINELEASIRMYVCACMGHYKSFIISRRRKERIILKKWLLKKNTQKAASRREASKLQQL